MVILTACSDLGAAADGDDGRLRERREMPGRQRDRWEPALSQAFVVAADGLHGDARLIGDGDGGMAVRRWRCRRAGRAADATGEPPQLVTATGTSKALTSNEANSSPLFWATPSPLRSDYHQPTAPSICSSMSRLSSSAYSIGSSLAIGSTNPRTTIAIASSSVRPRLIK